MNLPDTLWGEFWYWMAWAIWIPVFALSVLRAPWTRLKDQEVLNLWLAFVALLPLVWSLKAGVRPGLNLHLLGATVLTLCVGPHLAFIGLSIVTLAITINGDAGLLAYAVNALLLGGVSVWISHTLHRLISGFLPKHFFIFVFAGGFLGSALTILGVGTAASLLLATLGSYELEYLLTEYLPYFLLLAFAEAWISGMLLTLFVIYRPKWVVTFVDSIYLVDK